MKSLLSLCLLVISIAGISSQTPMSIEMLPDLTAARAYHVQIVPSAEKYMAIGGHVNGFYLTTSVESYNSGAVTWGQSSTKDNRDMSFVAKLLNGNYLIGAGCSSRSGVGQLASAEIYNPTDNTFTLTGSMNVARTNANSCVLSDGKVLVVGNWYASAAVADVYDPEYGTFTSTGNCISQRAYPVVLPLNGGDALVIGGVGIYGASFSDLNVERYNSSINTFTVSSSVLIDNKSDWKSAIYHPQISNLLMMHDGKYAFLIWRTENNVTTYKLASVDPSNAEIKEIITQQPIPVNDELDPSLVFGCNTKPLIDKEHRLIHIIQQAAVSNTFTLRIVTVNYETGSVNSATIENFNYSVASAANNLLDNGKILFSGGNKPDNFTLSAQSFLITPATYLETGIDNPKVSEITAYWDHSSQTFRLNKSVNSAELFAINGELIKREYNTQNIGNQLLTKGIYLLRIKNTDTGLNEIMKVYIP